MSATPDSSDATASSSKATDTAASIAAWRHKADNDFKNIRNNVAIGVDPADIPWDTICFHAQQASEKILKGYLVAHGVMPPKTHDLVTLLEQCIPHSRRLIDLESECIELTMYGVAPRYPDGTPDPTAAEGAAMIAAAEKIRDLVDQVLREANI